MTRNSARTEETLSLRCDMLQDSDKRTRAHGGQKLHGHLQANQRFDCELLVHDWAGVMRLASIQRLIESSLGPLRLQGLLHDDSIDLGLVRRMLPSVDLCPVGRLPSERRAYWLPLYPQAKGYTLSSMLACVLSPRPLPRRLDPPARPSFPKGHPHEVPLRTATWWAHPQINSTKKAFQPGRAAFRRCPLLSLQGHPRSLGTASHV